MPKRNLIVLSVLVIGLLIAVVAMVSGNDRRDPPTVEKETEAVTAGNVASDSVVADDPSEVPKAALTRTPVAPREAGEVEAAKPFDGLGPLDASQKADLRARLRKAVVATYARFEATARKRGSGPGGVETVVDVVDQLDVLLMAKRQEAKLAAIESDEYVTVARGEADHVKWPRGYLTSVSRTRHEIKGVRVDVVFGISPKHPMLASLYEEVRRLQGLVREYEIDEFNKLSFDDRKSRFAKNRAAVARLRNIDPALPEAERRAVVDSLMPDFLPGEWHIDDTTYYARLRR